MMFSFPTAPIMILMGGFVGSKLAFNPEFSTLPIALVVVGTVSGIIPATFLMKKIGRKKGFVLQVFILLWLVFWQSKSYKKSIQLPKFKAGFAFQFCMIAFV